ncbi:MAG: hypothetical protein V1793_16935 [Pseudomonadota bacterium]
MAVDVKLFFFDRRDHELIRIVNGIYDRRDALEYTKKRFYSYFHPLGIKELAESKGLRIASSAVHLLESLERGDEATRLQALQGLRDEILNTAGGSMPKNTARVLLQIMKEIIRARGDYNLQLKLAHDFRKTASGKPVIIRKQLNKYHLLEMPEEWNQVTFDDHVHDANTKGRKSSTHLIMDAWIKGIRRLRVIYYHHLEPRFVSELIEAAEILEMDLRIGIEFFARYRDRYVTIIWVARGLEDVQSYLCFLAEPHVIEFMKHGRAVVDYIKTYVLSVLESFNVNHRSVLLQEYGIDLPPLEKPAFLRFVTPGQASILHLAVYIHTLLREPMIERLEVLNQEYPQASPEEKKRIESIVHFMDTLTSKHIVDLFLTPEKNPQIPNPFVPGDSDDVPEKLRFTLPQLLEKLADLHHSYRITLNLSNLKVEDVLELLYDSNGRITRLEIFNLKDYAAGNINHLHAISELQQAINQGSFLKLKRSIRLIIGHMEAKEYPDTADRLEKLTAILHDLDTFRSMYKDNPLKARIGSDSTGRPYQGHGMGLGIIETLPWKARNHIRKTSRVRIILPITINVNLSVTSILINGSSDFLSLVVKGIRKIPGMSRFGSRKKREWIVEDYSTNMETQGNIVTLGGIQNDYHNDLKLGPPAEISKKPERKWTNLNTGIKNGLKVVIGFIPAFATFALTKDWWFLAYCGAFIWFGITGFRNILQSVLGGGGIRRSPLLRWNDYVSWERMTDSLLFTGFSVPLLDYLVKTLLLDRGMGINVSTSPTMTYAVMAVANGMYLSTHNAFRGFPKGAIVGNFFRSILSIPIAIAFNALIAGTLHSFGLTGVEIILQKWAAIISKASSDTVAGLIEGTADRLQNINLRARDYRNKFSDLFDTYAKLELIFPDANELELLEKPEKILHSNNTEARDLMTAIIINTLDMLYFWMYQPRARITVKEIIGKMTPEEKKNFHAVPEYSEAGTGYQQAACGWYPGKKILRAPVLLPDTVSGIPGRSEKNHLTGLVSR